MLECLCDSEIEGRSNSLESCRTRLKVERDISELEHLRVGALVSGGVAVASGGVAIASGGVAMASGGVAVASTGGPTESTSFSSLHWFTL